METEGYRIHLSTDSVIRQIIKMAAVFHTAVNPVRFTLQLEDEFPARVRVQTVVDLLTATGLVIYLFIYFGRKFRPVTLSRLTLTLEWHDYETSADLLTDTGVKL